MAKSSPLSGRIGSRFGGRGARKRTRIFAGFVTLIAVTYFGTTFAASISLGTGRLEFGQGARQAVACDADGVTTAISEDWSTSDSFFKVTTITLTGLNSVSTDSDTGVGCGGKKLEVSLMGSSGLLTIGTSSATKVSFTVPTSGSNPSTVAGVTNASSITLTGAGTTSTTAVITISPSTAVNATNVTYVGLETSTPAS
jgi:hypothetical protein